MTKIDFNLSQGQITAGDNIVKIGGSAGGLQLGNGSAVAATTSAGILRWNSGKLQVSDGSVWQDVTLGESSDATGDFAFAVAVAFS